ncbi:MAG: UTP--glucose-1-phosphate uridylyltransferase [Candidatus Cloacimonetes bacterium]|jgi:UDP-N-acetylglucosamine pyrophosphorylase|nr:UTP--glucose-1-phosphate uridylyltransferase [Candidatus Cloacimonadota bacterium]MCK9332207.1 UTP--glucose-1-phosphate uridylyltransferase [Candidatus Cloacimonadota bacterium]MDD3282690.1 UTP--glucose-1-phosphate uridylyltransferase [Candidatus Cloacimonadota bacterium]MDD4686810.1 UTP--glucose-1-phosphate uridylyltransferase [Candidatus Cloacimonadota bacterium]MDY0299127.1 UTP--glucose-1-phosphate uridylyltransferase [Candidatus Cloacimonadaceae bacterium]
MLTQFVKAMKAENLSDILIRTFSNYYKALESGVRGSIPESTIFPPQGDLLANYSDLDTAGTEKYLKQIAVVKLNGGLGTSMGLSKAKSLLPVKGNMNFLDIITRHILALRSSSGYDIQLLFMNSYATHQDTLNYLMRYPDLQTQSLPISFMQNKFPRIRQEELAPFNSSDKTQRWNPPGHGDIYTAISTTGILDSLIAKGYKYMFVSNSDNLGAAVDPRIASYMAKNDIPFLMEVCERTEMDKKGGHLAQDAEGNLLLREIAQCPADDLNNFQDINKYKYFNTNNLWIDLNALDWHLITNDGLMILPLIVNPKEVEGTKVFQLETAMGAAISSFSGAKALVVPRERFAPVKKTNDLLAIWSDLYELNDQYQIKLKRGVSKIPYIDLDSRYYGNIDQLLNRFETVPSLAGCKELIIEGDVGFGADVICDGRVHLKAEKPTKISNMLITGDLTYN